VPDHFLGVERASVSFGKQEAQVRALRGVSQFFERGTLSLVMGPSGSGKTTLLSLLGCLLSPDEGTVFVDGVAVNGLSEAERTAVRQRKSVLFSKPFDFFTLFPRLTMLPSASNFAIQPCLAEWGWQKIYSFDSDWGKSSTRSRSNLARGKSRELQLRVPWRGILLFSWRMSRLHRWMPKPEEAFVSFSETRLMMMEELLLS